MQTTQKAWQNDHAQSGARRRNGVSSGNSPANPSRWYDATVGKWLSEDPSGFVGGDGNLYRYGENAPTDGVVPSGLLDFPVAGPVPVSPGKLYGITFENQRIGQVQASSAEPTDGLAKLMGPGPGLYLLYTANQKVEQEAVGWVVHVVHIDVKDINGKNRYVFSDAPRYDNAFRGESDPTKPRQPVGGKEKECPWNGNPASPSGDRPKGESKENPLPKPSMYDRPQSDIRKRMGEAYIAQLVVVKTGQVLFNYYFYVDNGQIHGMQLSPTLGGIRMPQ